MISRIRKTDWFAESVYLGAINALHVVVLLHNKMDTGKIRVHITKT